MPEDFVLRMQLLSEYYIEMRRSRDAREAARVAHARGLRSRSRRMLLQRLVALPD